MIIASWNRACSCLRSVWDTQAPGRPTANLLADIVSLVLLGILSYGLLISSLGYYWDDWRVLWFGSSHSSVNILDDYAYRPGTAWLFDALNRYVGTNYALAHCLALAVRFASSLAFWRMARLVWPSCPGVTFASATLFLVYPGFTQQSISLTYQNYHVCIFLCILSLLAMLQALLTRSLRLKYLFLLIALLLELGYLFVHDGLIAWEAMRWTLILILAARSSTSIRTALRLSISRMLPFVATAVGFILWRAFWVHVNRDDVNFSLLLRSWRSVSFREIAITASGKTLSNILDSSIFAWPVQAWRGVNYDDKVLLAGLCVAILGAGLTYLRLRRRSTGAGSKSWSREFIFVGGMSLLANSIFDCAVQKNVRLDDQFNRFAYMASAASVFLVVGLCGFSLGKRATVHVITVLVGLSILSNFGHAYKYRSFWQVERSLSWQLAWRAPDIEPGALVVIARPRVGLWLEDLEFSHDINGPLNLHYTNSESPLTGVPLNERAVEFMKSVSDGCRDEILEYVRLNMIGNYGYVPPIQIQQPPGVLLMYLSYPGATLRTVDPDRLEELPELPEVPTSILLLAKYAGVGVIRGSGRLGVPTNQLVGKEPPHTWAWHFQQAELARQLGDYGKLSHYLAEVHRKHLSPNDPSEWLVFLEAAIRAKNEECASLIIMEIRARHKRFIPRIKTWFNKFLMHSEGSERAFATSLLEKVE
jgi:hypothetical protein